MLVGHLIARCIVVAFTGSSSSIEESLAIVMSELKAQTSFGATLVSSCLSNRWRRLVDPDFANPATIKLSCRSILL